MYQQSAQGRSLLFHHRVASEARSRDGASSHFSLFLVFCLSFFFPSNFIVPPALHSTTYPLLPSQALASSSWILGAQGYVAPIPNDPAPDSQPPSAKLALRYVCFFDPLFSYSPPPFLPLSICLSTSLSLFLSLPLSHFLTNRVICGPIAIALVVLSMIPMFFYQLDKKQVQTYHTKCVHLVSSSFLHTRSVSLSLFLLSPCPLSHSLVQAIRAQKSPRCRSSR